MRRVRRARPSPAIIVAILALVAGVTGAAVAQPAAKKAVTKKKAKRIADKEINKLAPDLSVANADALDGKPPSAFAPSAAEALHRVGASGQPQFQNDWDNSVPQLRTAGFYKDPFGVVHLEGAIDGGLADDVAFTLPPGYRPSKHC